MYNIEDEHRKRVKAIALQHNWQCTSYDNRNGCITFTKDQFGLNYYLTTKTALFFCKRPISQKLHKKNIDIDELDLIMSNPIIIFNEKNTQTIPNKSS